MKQLVRILVSIACFGLATMPALAEPPISSIKMINPTNFGIDHAELTDIKVQMQAAIESGHLPGAMLMVGNDDGVGVLLTVGTQFSVEQLPRTARPAGSRLASWSVSIWKTPDCSAKV